MNASICPQRSAGAGQRFVRLWTAIRTALARYRRLVAQPWRMSGDRVAHGNRR